MRKHTKDFGGSMTYNILRNDKTIISGFTDKLSAFRHMLKIAVAETDARNESQAEYNLEYKQTVQEDRYILFVNADKLQAIIHDSLRNKSVHFCIQ